MNSSSQTPGDLSDPADELPTTPGPAHWSSESISAASAGAWTWDFISDVMKLTPELCTLLALPAGTQSEYGRVLWQRVPDDYRAQVKGRLTAALHVDGLFEVEYPIVLEDGTWRWLQTRGRIYLRYGFPIGANGITFDVSDQYAKKQETAKSAARYRALVEAASALVWIADAEGNTVAEESEWETFAGPLTSGPTGSDWLSAVVPEDQTIVREEWRRMLIEKRFHRFNFRMRRRDGVVRSLSVQAAPLFDSDGSLSEWFGTITDTSTQDEAQSALISRNLELSLALRAANIRIMSLDVLDMCITLENHVSAINPLEPRPRVPYEVVLRDIFDEDIPALDGVLRRMAAGETDSGHFDYRIRRSDGVHFMKANVVLKRNYRGAPEYIIGSLLDVSESKQLETALRDADRRKDEFLAMLAHELRNPLAPLRTGVALLARGDAKTEGVDLVGMMSRQIEHMTHLVDDLLEVSRITQGRIVLQRELVPVDVALRRAEEATVDLVQARGQTLTLQIQTPNMYVFVDRNRLAQILVNVLNNACKYSPDGGRIDVIAYSKRQMVHIDIVDNGSGITPDLMPNVFDLFSQGTRTLDRSDGGLGIGLSIVKRLVDMQDGIIRMRSAGAGQGTTVALQFPKMSFEGSLAAEINKGPTRDQHDPTPVKRRHLRILVVDDNRDAADSLALLCETDEHISYIAYSAAEALAMAPQFAPDVALLDIGLPEMDGYELAARLREGCANPPVLIAVTGYGQDEDRLRSQKAGFAHHFVKPIDVNKLLHLLTTL